MEKWATGALLGRTLALGVMNGAVPQSAVEEPKRHTAHTRLPDGTPEERNTT